jgi:hypothetical protein
MRCVVSNVQSVDAAKWPCSVSRKRVWAGSVMCESGGK